MYNVAFFGQVGRTFYTMASARMGLNWNDEYTKFSQFSSFVIKDYLLSRQMFYIRWQNYGNIWGQITQADIFHINL